jgi:UDP-N-acetyl-2-amino-2-deoxyglucuronate dehydrogenase
MNTLKRSPKFLLVGAAGYVAPRHMEAIKAVGGELVAAVDPCDQVGILDRYFPRCDFYRTELPGVIPLTNIDYCVICTPNDTHAHIACWALENGMNVILEKPAALRVEDLDRIRAYAQSRFKTVNCILNLRLHHDAILLRAVSRLLKDRAVVDIEYCTPRGPWYARSWKSQFYRSGGLLFNIGVHLIDLALLAFGPLDPFMAPKMCARADQSWAVGALHLEKADVFIKLSIDRRPKRRTFTVGGAEFDFTNGFEDLHIESYRRIIRGQGFSLEDAKPAIELCERIGGHAS